MVDKPQDWSRSANGNTAIAGINIGEGCAFASMNNMGREIMAAVAVEFAEMAGAVSAATLTTISGASQSKYLTGATTISGFDTAVTGLYREMIAASTLVLAPTTALGLHRYSGNISLEPGALIKARSLGAGNWVTFPQRATGLPMVNPTVDTSVGKHMVPVLAGAMIPATTNGAASGTIETTTNKVMYKTLDFDQTTQEFAAFVIPWPKSADESTVTFRAWWTAASGAGTVVWALQALGRSDGDAIDTAYGTEITVSDIHGSANQARRTAESAAVTISTLAESDLVFFRIKRVPADASDDLTADARLIAVELYLTTNATTDA